MALSGDELESLWDEVTGTEYLEPGTFEYDTAYEQFQIGFGFSADDYEELGIDPETVSAAREDFFDLMGMEYEDFPWDEWREAMGYE
jgi:hypothetical protein